MELNYDPRWPWHLAATACAMLFAGVTIFALVLPTRRMVLGRTPLARLGGAIFLVFAAISLGVASWNPQLVQQRDPERVHLAVVIDLSPSMLRADGGWTAVRTATANLLTSAIDKLTSELLATGTGSIIVFRNDASEAVLDEIPLADLADRVRSIQENAIGGDGSDLEAGLLRAGERIREAGGRGAVLLVSDGLETEGNAENGAKVLASAGIPVFSFGVTSKAAELAIVAADLPRQARAGAETLLRATVWNARNVDATSTLSITLNSSLTGESPRVSSATGLTEPITLALTPGGAQFPRAPLTFGGYGLQFADLTLSYDGGNGLQRRRFFTHVKRPLEILSIGGDRRWQRAFPEDAANFREIKPGELATAGDLRAYDAVVISAVAAKDFATGELQAISDAVEREGLGLMLFNGDHGGADPEAATILKSYDSTPIADLLPVESGPRPFEEEPPSRHVVFLIDASGSMDGWPLDKAKEIVAYIIENEMRPADKVDIIAFNTSALHLVQSQETIPSAKAGIIAQLASIQAGGGTDPREALQLIADKQFTECGLIFLSDGEFEVVNLRPDCRATAFSIGGGFSPALSQIADPFPVDPSFSPAGITLPYFKPEKRTRLWEPGTFSPLSTAVISRTAVHIPVPELPLPGSAISHPKPKAQVIAVRPKVKDPILAYAEYGAGFVGVMTSAVTDEWLADEKAASAVEEWVRQVTPYAARDRYDLLLRDDGARIELQIALVAQDRQIPNISGLQMTLEQPGHPPLPIPVDDVPGAPATFKADFSPERAEAAAEATLVIRESGSDRLSRPQRIPLIVPPAGLVTPKITSEAYGFGQNDGLLRKIAAAGGGRLLATDDPGVLLQAGPPGVDRRVLWPWFVLIGALFYFGAIVVKRVNL